MTNVLIVYGTEEITAQLTTAFFKKLSSITGKIIVRSNKAINCNEDDINWCDIIVFIRSRSPLESGLAALAKKRNCLCCLMIDDDFFSLKGFKSWAPLENKSLNRVLCLTDIIISSSEYLANKLCSQYSIQKYARIDTIVDRNDVSNRRFLDKEELNVAYYVNDGTTICFDTIIKPLIPRLYKLYGNRIKWHFFTVSPDLGDFENRYLVVKHPRMALNDFRRELSEGNYDVGIAPLLDDEFSKSKYYNKYLEYTLAAIPGIYSDVPPYSSVIINKSNGILCKNTDDWIEAFGFLQHRDNRALITKNAQEQLLDYHNEKAIIQTFLDGIPELLIYKTNSTKAINKVDVLFVHVRSFLAQLFLPLLKIISRLKYDGIKELFEAMKSYIKRKTLK